jgi:hypothetical protein
MINLLMCVACYSLGTIKDQAAEFRRSSVRSTIRIIFESALDPDAHIQATKETLFYLRYPRVVACDLAQHRKIWEENLYDEGELKSSLGIVPVLNSESDPVETGGVVVFCMKCLSKGGAIKGLLIAAEKTTGRILYRKLIGRDAERGYSDQVAVDTSEIPILAVFGRNILVASSEGSMTTVTVISLFKGTTLCSIQNSATSSQSQLDKALPGIGDRTIPLGSALLDHGALRTFESLPHDSPSQVVPVNEGIVAEYRTNYLHETYANGALIGVKLLTSPSSTETNFSDSWQGKYASTDGLQKSRYLYGPYLGDLAGLLCILWVCSLV